MSNKCFLKLKKMFPSLFYENSNSKTTIEASDLYFENIVNFCKEISKKSKSVKITMIKESSYGLSFYINEYNEELLDIVCRYEKNNFKTMCK